MKIKRQSQEALLKAAELQQKQTKWEQALRILQIQLRGDFEKLQEMAQKEVSMLKSKIWYLEEKGRQPTITHRNYQKMRVLEEQKEELRMQVDIKQAENIVLNQVKEYYENRFHSNEIEAGREQRATRVIMARRVAHTRKQSCREPVSRNVDESREMVQMRKYITHCSKKQQQTPMSKTGYSGFSFFERIKTNPI